MPDRQKVIKALTCCVFPALKGFPYQSNIAENGCEVIECPYRDDCDQMLFDALALLKEQPEQKHGHWIEHDDYPDPYYECSVCKEPWVLIDGTPLENGMHFCPKCGAIMDGEAKQDA